MIARIAAAFCALLLTVAVTSAQSTMGRRPGGTSGRSGSGQSGRATRNGMHAEKTDTVKPGNAWTLTFPLGDHVEAPIDTFTYNYQRQAIPSMASDAYATTGNLGAEGINLIFSERPERATFFFQDALHHWMPSFQKQKFYNVYIPTTFLSYNFAGNKINHSDRLNANFAGNVNRRIGIGAMVDYLYSKGCFEAQATKDFSFGFSTYYFGDRYELQAFYNHFNFLNKENGGITDDLYITDPAQLQGGVNTIEPKSIPTNLTAAHNRLNGDELFMTHAWKVGFWKSEQINDTLSRQVYIPVTRFVYSFNLQHRHHNFMNTDSRQGAEFWKNCYLDPTGSREETYLTQMTNSIGFQMIEGFQKWAPFGLSAYISYQTEKYRLPTDFRQPELDDGTYEQITPLPVSVPRAASRNLVWAGGRLQKDKGSIIRYAANARFGIVGDVAGDMELDGNIRTNIPLLGDTVAIKADARFRNLAQPWLIQNYVSNHFAWRNDFGKSRSYKIGGELSIPWTRTRINVDVENLENMVYFNQESLPEQFNGHVQVFSASLHQNFRLGILNWDNSLHYQKSSNDNVLPLPQFAVYSNLYLKFIAFKVLKLQLGVDCDYFTKYNSLVYQPATMTFHVQGPDPVKIGNYPYCNLYATARLYQTRFYVLWSHANQGIFSKDSFSLPHYPLNPRRLELGLSIEFTD